MMNVKYILLLWWLCFSSAVTTKFQKEETLYINSDAHFNDTIVIGAPISFDMHDKHFTTANQMKQSWGMYTEWVNNRGGIMLRGRNVSLEVICVEDYSDSYYVEDAVNYLLNSDPPAHFFLAPYSRYLY